MKEDALSGIRVLDFSWLLAGPYATRLLGDFGAEVIKVQSARTASGAESNASGYFNTWNRNKRGITLDMAHPEGRELALRLVKISDVVVENFTPRVMANWGLGYQSLREAKPDIIMLSLSGMGQTGPWRDYAALGPTVQALSGFTRLTSFPQGPPQGMGYSYADPLSGMFAVLAVLAALENRDATGEGQYIDISEYEAMCSLLGPALLDYSVNGNIAEPQGNADGYSAPCGCYKCRGNDRWCAIAVSSEEEWQALCRVIGLPWTGEERFSTLPQRRQHAGELDGLLERWTASRTPQQVVQALQQAGVPCGAVNSAADLVDDPQLRERGFLVQMPHPVLGNTTSDGTPIRLSRTPARFRRAAPLLGQDNEYVYRELLGLDEKQFRQYLQKGVIA